MIKYKVLIVVLNVHIIWLWNNIINYLTPNLTLTPDESGVNTIPLWRNQLVMTLGIEHSWLI